MNAVYVHSVRSMTLDGAGGDGYPAFAEFAPTETIETSHYQVRFAADRRDLEAVQRLRYRVFNLELGEGLDIAHAIGRDEDPFDRSCHHLMVISKADQQVIGTYRMQTSGMAGAGRGFYCDTLFDLSGLPAEIRSQAIETGRACIAAEHRNGRVLFLLWRGLAMYLKHNHLRYLFGSSSLPSQDPEEGLAVYNWLAGHGLLHDRLRLQPRPGRPCILDAPSIRRTPPAKVPPLMRLYLDYGAKVCGPPAMDREFKTIDFLTLLDVEQFDPRIRKKLFG